METVSIRLPDTLGCSVASTAVVAGLLHEYDMITVVTPFPWLLQGFSGVDIVEAKPSSPPCNIDLRHYTARRPHNTPPYRPSYIHMLEMAEAQLDIKLNRESPRVILSENDHLFGENEVALYDKPLIWFQSQATSPNRLWGEENWTKLKAALGEQYSFVDLSRAPYSPRESLSLAKHSFAGVCLDSFMLHGSAAVGADNVLVILGSSRPECVTYSGQTVFYTPSQCHLQPCGMHGYFNGCLLEHEALFLGGLNCVHDQVLCMQTTQVETVIRTILSL
ncbi:hypothetical protein V9N52_004226 [Vibrio navarrensis]